MKPGECPTLGCVSEQGSACSDYDHLGQLRWFCCDHSLELEGVRERITALLDQIEGLHRVLTQTTMLVTPDNLKLAAEMQKTLLEQGDLLVLLIKRERELTGVAGGGK